MTANPLVEGLTKALTPVLGAGVQVDGLERLSGGASRETWRFESEPVDGARRALILRRDPPSRPSLPGGMELEARVIRAAHAAGLVVPDVLVDDETGGMFGSAGIVMELVPGETIARRILRDDEYGEARDQHLTGQCGEFLAGLHALSPDTVPGLATSDPLTGLRDWYEQVGHPSPTFELAFRWLAENRPDASGDAVVHGDFRLGNLIVGNDGLRAVLDWELVHRGDPLEDLGWLCTKAWRFGSHLPVGGFGTYDDLVAAYEKAGGAPVDREALRWWEIYGALRWGVICMGQAAAHLFGAVRSVELAAIGRRVCEQEWDLLGYLEPEAVAALPTVTVVSEDGVARAEEDRSLHGRPTAVELLDAVREFLEQDVAGATAGRVNFHSRVAAKVVATVARELELGAEQQARHADGLARLGASGATDLAEQIRAGALAYRHDELAEFLAVTVRDKLTVANPGYLPK